MINKDIIEQIARKHGVFWIANYKDNTYLIQYDIEDKEHLFSEIDQTKLVEFLFFYYGKLVGVVLEHGIFGVNGLLHRTDISERKDVEYRLIYFARRQRNLSTGGSPAKDNDAYHIGFQCTIDGKNHKRAIELKNNFFNIYSG